MFDLSGNKSEMTAMYLHDRCIVTVNAFNSYPICYILICRISITTGISMLLTAPKLFQ